MPEHCGHPAYPLALLQADQAREDFAAISEDLDFRQWQLARLPTRAWIPRPWQIGFGSVWALLAAVLLLAR